MKLLPRHTKHQVLLQQPPRQIQLKLQFRLPVQLNKKCRQEISQKSTLQRSSTGTWTNDKKTLDTSTSEQDIANKLGQTF
jgi:hypothetical protein